MTSQARRLIDALFWKEGVPVCVSDGEAIIEVLREMYPALDLTDSEFQ